MTMIKPAKVVLMDPEGNTIAELQIADEEEGWFTGTVDSQSFPLEATKALAWYEEVVRDQMLSYLDAATAAVDRFDFQAKFPDGSAHKVYCLHVTPSNDVSFRTSPVAPHSEPPRGPIQ
jgi:hypothetical protein